LVLKVIRLRWYNDLITLLLGLRQDAYFSDVNLISVGLEEGIIRFTLSATAKVSQKAGRST